MKFNLIFNIIHICVIFELLRGLAIYKILNNNSNK